MVYKATIPNAGDKLKISQPEIKENFSQLDSLFDVDHLKFSDISGDAGKHKSVTLTNLTNKSLVPPVTGANELSLYNDAGIGSNELFIGPINAGTGIQVTGFITKSGNGQAPLLGGMSMKWGNVAYSGSGDHAVTYTGLSLNAFGSSTYSVIITPLKTGSVGTTGNSKITSQSATGFIFATNTSNSGTMNFIAIGQ